MSRREVALFSHGRVAPPWLDRTLLLMYLLLFFQGIQYAMMYALAPTFADALELSKVETSLMFTASALAAAAVALPIGLVVDRIGARRVCLVGGIVGSASLVLQGLAPDLLTLVISRVGVGAGFAAVFTAGITWISDSAPPEHRSAAAAAIMPISGLSSIVGPLAGGALADAFGRATPLVLLAGLTAACIGALLLSPPGGSEPHGHDAVLSTIARGRSSPLVLTALLLFGIGLLADVVTGVLAPLQFDDNGLSASAIGAVLAAGGVLFIVAAIGVTRAAEKAACLPVAAAAFALLGLIVILLAASSGTPLTAASMVLRGCALGIVYTLAVPLASMGADAAGIGRGAVFAALQLVTGLAGGLAPTAAGAISEAAGDRTAYVVVAALCFAAMAWTLAASRRRRRGAILAG